MYGRDHFGPGVRASSTTRTLYPIFNGMRSRYSNITGKFLSDVLMSHGLQIPGGSSRFVNYTLLSQIADSDSESVKSKLPEDAKPLCILLYADKTRLSSFGTAKAHPVIARCANLPIEIRNGEEIDGGRVVGWLPIVRTKRPSKLINSSIIIHRLGKMLARVGNQATST
jgi:hypothetical protein